MRLDLLLAVGNLLQGLGRALQRLLRAEVSVARSVGQVREPFELGVEGLGGGQQRRRLRAILAQDLIGVERLAPRRFAGGRRRERDRRAHELDERLLGVGGRHVGQHDLERQRHRRRRARKVDRRRRLADAEHEGEPLVQHRRRVDELAPHAHALVLRRRGDVDQVEALADRLPAGAREIGFFQHQRREALAEIADRALELVEARIEAGHLGAQLVDLGAVLALEVDRVTAGRRRCEHRQQHQEPEKLLQGIHRLQSFPALRFESSSVSG